MSEEASAEEMEEAIMAKAVTSIKISKTTLLSSGSTLLDLACSGRIVGGFVKGTFIYFIGDSSSGKSWFTLTCFAEAAMNKNFAEYDFIYDAPENGALMDFGAYFGKAAAARIHPPQTAKDGQPQYSETIEDFYYNLDDANASGKPFIYVLDSMDALTSADEAKKFQERKANARSGSKKKVAGDYGDGKAKANSRNIRAAVSALAKTGSILIVISQTRDNIDPFSFETQTRAGGRALKFYSHVEIWTSVKGAIKKTVKDRERKVGMNVVLNVKKNRLTGKEWKVEVPFLLQYGIDNVGGMVDYLVQEGHWKQAKGASTIQAEDFQFTGTRAKLIAKIESEGIVRQLKSIVGDVWKASEEALIPDRPSRYK